MSRRSNPSKVSGFTRGFPRDAVVVSGSWVFFSFPHARTPQVKKLNGNTRTGSSRADEREIHASVVVSKWVHVEFMRVDRIEVIRDWCFFVIFQ